MDLSENEERFLVAAHKALEKGLEKCHALQARADFVGGTPEFKAAEDRSLFVDPYLIGRELGHTSAETKAIIASISDLDLFCGSKSTNGKLIGVALSPMARTVARRRIENSRLPNRAKALAASVWSVVLSGIIGGVVSGLIVAYAAWKWGWTK